MKKYFLILFLIILSSCDGPKKEWDRCDIYIEDIDKAIINNDGKLYTKHSKTLFDVLAKQKGHIWYMWLEENSEPLEYEEQYVECVDIPDNQITVVKYNPVFSSYKWQMAIEIRNGFNKDMNIESIDIELKIDDENIISKQEFIVDKIIEPNSYIHLDLIFDDDNTFISVEESKELKLNYSDIIKDTKVSYYLVE